MSVHPPQRATDPDATTTLPRTAGGAVPPRRAAPARRAAPPPRRIPIAAVVAAAVVLLLGALYLVGYLLAGDKLPRNASVAGIMVGGLSQAAALDRLSAELGPRAAAPLPVAAAGKTAQLDPVAAGLSVDYPASVAAAGGGKSADPVQIFRVLTGGSDTDPVVRADPARLGPAVQDLATGLDQQPANAALAYRGVEVRRTPARPGITVRQPAAAGTVRAAFLQARTTPLPLPVDVVEPAITDAEVDQVVADYAEPAVSGPVTVEAGPAGTVEITPAMIASAVTFKAQGGTPTPSLDAARLRSSADPALQKLALTKAKGATVRIVDGKPKVVAAVDGAAVAADQLAKAVEPVLTRTGGQRTAEVELTTSKATFTTQDAQQLGIKEVTGQFTTYFPSETARNTNIGRAAAKLDNTVLKPGATFSFNKVVGEPTKANGFTDGLVIKGDRLTEAPGGGVDQSATTLFNAMFFAGLKDVQHQPHALYLDRYPPGREADVAWPKVDLKFQNDTSYGVLVQATTVQATPTRQGSITVKMWSTKTYERVSAAATERSRVTTGRTVRLSSASCEPMDAAPGFDADYQRLFYRNGNVVKRENFEWRYAPTDKVTCS